MSKLELNQIYLQLGHEMNHASQFHSCCFKNLIKEDAHDVILEIKPEIDSWENQLNDRKISCYELENLVKAKCSKIKLSRMKFKCRTSEELEMFKNFILNLIAKAIMNAYLNLRFDFRTLLDKERSLDRYPVQSYFV